MITSKAQSAIEYLMTYGWMLLVVAIAGGAIFSVSGGQNVESISGFIGNNVQIDDFGITSGGDLNLVLRNADSDILTINSVNVTDGENFSEWYGDESISVGDTGVITLANVSSEDSTSTLDVVINYNSGNLNNLQSSGTITGNLQVTEDSSSGSQGATSVNIDGFESQSLGNYDSFKDGSSNGQGYIFNDTGGKEGAVSLNYDGYIPLNGFSTYHRIHSTSGLNSYPEIGESFHGWMRYTENGNPGVLFGGPNVNNTYEARLYASYDHIEINKWDGANAPMTLNDTDISSANIQENQWYGIEIDWAENGDINAELYDEGLNMLGSVTASDTEYSQPSFGISNYNYGLSGSFNTSWDGFEKGPIN